jgi:hypothetical protein
VVRTIVYRQRLTSPSGDKGLPVYGTGGGDGGVVPDELSARILKYIPGETLTIILPASLLPGLGNGGVAVVAIAGAIGTPWYLARQARKQEPQIRPVPRFYLLAVLAYCAWILASSSPTREMLGVAQGIAAMCLFLVAYFIPLLDNELDKRSA